MEIWDGYLKDGSLAGVDLIRGEKIPSGLYHLVSEVLVRHIDGDYLLMQRDYCKHNYGGYYEASAGGSALKGEDKLTCAKRELQEETGINVDKDSFIEVGYYVSNDTIYYSFLCVIDYDKTNIKLQKNETISYKWINEKEFIAFINSNDIMDIQKIRYDDFFKKKGYIK